MFNTLSNLLPSKTMVPVQRLHSDPENRMIYKPSAWGSPALYIYNAVPSQRSWAWTILVPHFFNPRPVSRTRHDVFSEKTGWKATTRTSSEWQQLTAMHPCSQTLLQLSFVPSYLFPFAWLFCFKETDENNIPSPGPLNPLARLLEWEKSHKAAAETPILNRLSAWSSARALLAKAHAANRHFKSCFYSSSSPHPRLEAQPLCAQPWPSARVALQRAQSAI